MLRKANVPEEFRLEELEEEQMETISLITSFRGLRGILCRL